METDQLSTEWKMDKDKNTERNVRLFKIERKWIHSITKLMVHNEHGPKRKVHGTKYLPRKKPREISH